MKPSTRPLVFAWLALLALLAATFAIARVPLGVGNTIVAIAIATAKTAIVGWWFMHLRVAGRAVRLAAAAAVFMLVLLGTLSGVDYATRLDEPAAVQAPRQIEPLVVRNPDAHDGPR